jgi:N-acyl homoserine lactone hydrolase
MRSRGEGVGSGPQLLGREPHSSHRSRAPSTPAGCRPSIAKVNRMNVHAIQTGTVAVKTRQRRGERPGRMRLAWTLMDRQWTDPLPIYAWLIASRGPDRRGHGRDRSRERTRLLPPLAPLLQARRQVVGAAGGRDRPEAEGTRFSPVGVRWVVITQLHTDHAGGLGHFPESEILVSRPEFANASGFMGQARGFLPQAGPSGSHRTSSS